MDLSDTLQTIVKWKYQHMRVISYEFLCYASPLPIYLSPIYHEIWY